MRSSSAMTIAASSMSWCSSASSVRSSVVTTRSSAPSACSSSARSSCWKWRRPWPVAIALPELARDVVLRARVVRVREDLVRLRELDQLAVEHEGGLVGHARGLLHVVGDDDDRIALLELVDELLDLQRGD